MPESSLAAPSRAATSKHSPAREGGDFSRARLARMREALQRHVASGHVPGVVALVYHRGRVHVETLGAVAFDSNVPVRRDTIFRLASTTKPLTAVGAMILVEECKIRLDDPVTNGCRSCATAGCSERLTARSMRPCQRSVRSRCATCSRFARDTAR